MVARAVRRSGSAGRFAPLQKPPAQDESAVGKTDTKAIEAPKKVGVAAESISDRLLQSFGEVSNNQWAKTVIASELKNYLRLGRKVISEEDVSGLESRIRTVLAGGGPTRTEKTLYKQAIREADEWGRMFDFVDQEGEAKDNERRRLEAAKHVEAVRFLHQQMQGEQQRHKQEAAEELADARRQDADYKAWLAAEAAKEAAIKQGMLKLKTTVAEQLAERIAQKQMEATLRLQEEQGISNAMAAELKAKMEAEVEAGVKSTAELRRLLAANEVNKAIKEKQRQEEQALDRKYAREYAAKLDKDEQARLEQLAKRTEYQARQAAIAQALPESKRWIDPAIIDRNFKSREEAELRQEEEQKQARAAARAVFKAQLADQIAERKVHRDHKKVEVAQEEAALEETIRKEKAEEAAEKAQEQKKREALRRHLEQQLEDALTRKLTAEPAMSAIERAINAPILCRMQAAKTLHSAPAAVAQAASA